ncbi:deoxyhypusine synthase-like isoform X1 [Babylonia areolata]|uniref:deoxyhypusine synthase-like isoform X1 n=2 Tax=Babylonia areolata TaxID=304850 RepID=UPI003FD55502
MKAKKLSSAGYVFRKDRENEKIQKTTWRCTRRGCPGRAYTQWCDGDQRMAVHHTQAHIHGPDPDIPDSVEWVENAEVRRTAPITLSLTQDVPREVPWVRPRVDASTQLSAHNQSQSHRHSSGETSRASSTATSATSSSKRKNNDEPDVDIDFDVDLDVHFDVARQHSSSQFLNLPGPSSGSVQQTTKVPRMMAEGQVPQSAVEAVMVRSQGMPVGSQTVRGYDFNNGIDYHELFRSFTRTGFQATNVGKAIEEINKMITCKMQPVPEEHRTEMNFNPCGREKSNCTIFLSFTSNLISAGTREVIRYLVQHNMVDCLVTTAGGIEEDFIKCLAPTYLGDFTLPGRELRNKGINRIGNLLVPNDNYCMFEDWLTPILDRMLHEQREQGLMWTPSKMIHRLGKEINNPDSVYYWAYRNNIPVFCPALTDGSLGDIMFFHSYKNPGLIVDIVEDLRRMNNQAMYSVHTGMIILGGGVCKHHTCNANLMRNGADFSVFVNTAAEFDGSDSGARPDEAISWGKIKMTATPVKVYGEASVIFPILVGETFARRHAEFSKNFSRD